ncbi:ABC transporter permease [Methylocaldum sp.]|uniref:ABC transporter permease n=1 Tax=Methylocaldum sp. TaxID=1969727 RepID=UPI002D7267C0|nr:ABC transporter permease [Methylocaldum sp.]HYE35242.1 ABC transporter permease [Methylocaldum sp.]
MNRHALSATSGGTDSEIKDSGEPSLHLLTNTPELVIKPGYSSTQYWKDLWHYRELLYFLCWRDLIVRYKQTAIGVVWALIRPLLTTLVFTVVFGTLAKLPATGVPYPLMVFAGMLPWQLFASALTDSSTSLLNNSHLISKVYFPRLLVPFGAVAVTLVDFSVSAMLFITMMIWYGIVPDWRVATLPIFILLALSLSLGAGLWFASFNVKYRDFRYIVPVVIQLGLYISPVGFSREVIPEQWRLWYSLNPMVAVIDGFRWALLGGTQDFYLPGFYLSLGIAVFLLITGIWYFRRVEGMFADKI